MELKIYTTKGQVAAPAEPTAVTVGVFDGVHRGHQDLIAQLSHCEEGLSTVVVTLTSHPAYVLGRRERELWLDDPEEHRELLFEAGARYVAELPFTQEVSRLTACQMAKHLHERLQMRHLLIGYDSRFGSRSNDDFAQLGELGKAMGFAVSNGQRYTYGTTTVSSSTVRRELQNGDVAAATELLGHCYRLRGRVEHGRGVGHTLGYPTANVDLGASRKMLPKDGVYAVRLDGRAAMANLGEAPTYGVEQRTLEVHVIDYECDIYGKEVEVTFVRRLRDTQRFGTTEELQRQLQDDMINAKRWL